jgi:uncharacterized membrane protein HdeD (DUF308 family)
MSRRSERDAASEVGDATFPVTLDPLSRRRLKIFTLKLAVVVLFAAALAIKQHYPALRTLAVFFGCQSLFAGAIAAIQRQRIDTVSLNAWDEMAAFFAVTMLVRLVAAFAG